MVIKPASEYEINRESLVNKIKCNEITLDPHIHDKGRCYFSKKPGPGYRIFVQENINGVIFRSMYHVSVSVYKELTDQQDLI